MEQSTDHQSGEWEPLFQKSGIFIRNLWPQTRQTIEAFILVCLLLLGFD